MNNTNQNHTDDFFKQGLSSPPEFVPSDKNWEDMERLLKPEPKRRIGWIYPVAGIAAALLVFFSIWLVSDSPVSDTTDSEIALGTKNEKKSNGTNSIANSNIKRPAPGEPGRTYTSIPTTRNIAENDLFTAKRNSGEGLPLLTDRSPLTEASYLAVTTSYAEKFTSLSAVDLPKAPSNVAKKDPAPDLPKPSLPGKWTLSLALSPDLNTVKTMENSDFGLSMGAGVSYRIGKTLSVGTGVYYSQKLYSADKTSYKVSEKPFATWTSYSKQIDADCRVIDIPLNFSMQVANIKANKLSASAGLSSYIMLSEKYTFIYNPSPVYPTGRREYTIRNENKHYLSVVNLGIALEKPLSKQVSLVVQPYAKLPLTGIGKGETDLKSFGVGFRLNYSLKRKKAFVREHAAPTPIADQE